MLVSVHAGCGRGPLALCTISPLVPYLTSCVLTVVCPCSATLPHLHPHSAPSSSMWLSNSPWCLMWDAYCNVLTTRPVATKLATGMVGTFLGDMVAQFTQGLLNTHANVTSPRGKASSSSGGGASSAGAAGAGGAASGFDLDFRRTARLVGFSALVGTPVAFVWFSLLDQVSKRARGSAAECLVLRCFSGLHLHRRALLSWSQTTVCRLCDTRWLC